MINPAALATELGIPLEAMWALLDQMVAENGWSKVISDGLVIDGAADVIRAHVLDGIDHDQAR